MHKPPSTKVGDTYKSNRGDVVVVTEYVTSKKMKVMFEDGVEIPATHVNLKRGSFDHPTKYKIKVGDKFKSKRGDEVTVVKYNACADVEVVWQDGLTTTEYAVSLKSGSFKHPTRHKFAIGHVLRLNSGESVRVVEYNSATDVVVEFDDGTRVRNSKASLDRGQCQYPTAGTRIGSVHTTKSGWQLTVIGYKDAHNVLVKWQDGTESWEAASNVKIGAIKPTMQPSVEGIGYFGVGRFVSGLHSEGEKAPERLYAYWVRMFSRCYNPKELNKSKNASYREIHVNVKWHNFQNFAEWALKQYNTKDYEFELDKDLLCRGVKEYNEDNCCFIPSEINLFLMRQEAGDYYRGVHIIQPKTPNSAIGYIARCCTGKGREYLGFYQTPELAFAAYKKRKESYAKELANKWKDQIDPRAYKALMEYAVEITD